MVMLDGTKIELEHIIVAIAKNQRLFVPSWKDIVIPEYNGISDIVRKLNEEEIERAWSML